MDRLMEDSGPWIMACGLLAVGLIAAIDAWMERRAEERYRTMQEKRKAEL